MVRILSKFFFLVCMAGILASCGVVRGKKIADTYTAEQLRTISVLHLCQAKSFGKYNRNVELEIKRRGLQDCSKEERKCIDFGYKAGTEGYRECRLKLELSKSKKPHSVRTRTNPRDTPTCRAARATRGYSCTEVRGTARVNCSPDPIPWQCE